MLGVGPVVEQPGDAADDRSELVVGERPDQDAAGVMAVRLGPLSKQRREVAGVACHEDPSLLGGELEDLRVIQRAERRVGREAEHVVAALGEWSADALGRQVRIEQEAQPSGFHNLDEREQRP